MIEPIDFVFPFVDDRDKVWQETFSKQFHVSYASSINEQAKFRSWNLLRYLFRGIECCAPFIRNVYMIVSNKEQVPDYINTKEIKIILHKDIIPQKYLPTFSSPCIEMFLKNIPNLSEHFIYGNDDTFFISKTTPEMFFADNGKIKTNILDKVYTQKTSMFLTAMFNQYQLLARYFDVIDENELKFKLPPHNLTPMLKSSIIEASKIFEKEIEKSISKTRTNHDLNQYFWTLYNYFTNKIEASDIIYKQFCCSDDIYIITDIITKKQAHAICINDATCDNTLQIKQNIDNAFLQIFNKQSKYELYNNRPSRPGFLAR